MEHDPRRPLPHASPINGWVHGWCGPLCPWHGEALRADSFRRAAWRGLRHNRTQQRVLALYALWHPGLPW